MTTRRLVKSVGLAVAVVMLAACSTGAPPPSNASLGPGSQVAGRCPEPRTTERAPDSYYRRKNPLPSADNLERGRLLFEQEAKPVPCASCHGIRGDGKGPASAGLVPPPRNFACAETMNRLPDGQLYWVIENGSGPFHLPSTQGAQQIERPGRGTPFAAMGAYSEYLSEPEIWQLVLYIRSLARERDR